MRGPVDSPSAWTSADVPDPDLWSFVLSDAERDEIVDAAARDDFGLTGLYEKIAQWSHALSDGLGFVLVRRFPVDRLDPEPIERAYVGLGTRLGTPVSQDAHGSLLTHIVDEGVARTGPEVRLYRTNERQDFHSDGADFVGLLCLAPAKRGGGSRIASALAVYNEIARRRPDLLSVLREPMYWDRNDEQADGEDPFFAFPVLSDVTGVPRFFYIGWYIRDAQRHPAVPRLTHAQRDAMELIESIANDPAIHLEMDFEPGDIQLLNNATILHAREAYEDDEDPTRRRHLLRLWLRAHAGAQVDDALRAGIPRRG
jgi:hypothetical protein